MRKLGFTVWSLLWACLCKGQTVKDFNPFDYDTKAYEAVRINYHTAGKGDTTLLFIHGWNLNQTYWDNQLPEFSKKYRVVVLDLAGHGSSGKNRINWTIESFSRDIVSIIERESLRNVVLVAHSMGGEIALEVAATLPNTTIGIIGVDNFKDVTISVTEQHRQGVKAYIRDFIDHYPQRAEAMARENMVTTNPSITERIISDYKTADPAIAVPVLMNLFPKAAQAKVKLQQLNFPLKIIMSDYAPYQEDGLKRYCRKGYQIQTIAHTGHFPMVEQPEKFNEALWKFLVTR